jgi:hypothetical protein
VANSYDAKGAAIAGAIQEAFDYPAGTVVDSTTNLNGGTGWNANGSAAEPNSPIATWASALNNGANRSITSPGLTSPAIGYLQGSGNKLTLDSSVSNATQSVGRSLDQTINAGTSYFSFLVSKNTPDTIRTINLAFFDGTTEQFAVGQIGTASGNTGGNIGLLMNNSNPGGLVVGGSPTAMGTNIAHLIIGRIDWNAGGNETVSLWVDPANVISELAAGAVNVSTSNFNLTGITAIRPFTGNNATIDGFNGNAVSANFDEIRLGGTWESVVVPEPCSTGLAFLSLGSLGLMRRRL